MHSFAEFEWEIDNKDVVIECISAKAMQFPPHFSPETLLLSWLIIEKWTQYLEIHVTNCTIFNKWQWTKSWWQCEQSFCGK